MAFESVKESGVTWNPCFTGKKKDGDLKELNADDKSHLIGYFKGSKEIETQDGTSMIHKVQLETAGTRKHFSGECEKGDVVSVWGTGVLNEQMASINPGAFIKIEWKGKVIAKKSGRPYHTWDVGVDRSVEPLAGAASFSADTVDENKAEPAVSSGAAESFEGDDDDSLPF